MNSSIFRFPYNLINDLGIPTIDNEDEAKITTEQIIGMLKDDEQQLLRLRYEKELTFSDIADLVGVSDARVEQRLTKIIGILSESSLIKRYIQYGCEYATAINKKKKEAEECLDDCENELKVLISRVTSFHTLIKKIDTGEIVIAPREVAQIPVEELGLSNRITNQLNRHDCSTLADLLSLRIDDFKQWNGMGVSAIHELKKRLFDIGITLEE